MVSVSAAVMSDAEGCLSLCRKSFSALRFPLCWVCAAGTSPSSAVLRTSLSKDTLLRQQQTKATEVVDGQQTMLRGIE